MYSKAILKNNLAVPKNMEMDGTPPPPPPPARPSLAHLSFLIQFDENLRRFQTSDPVVVADTHSQRSSGIIRLSSFSYFALT